EAIKKWRTALKSKVRPRLKAAYQLCLSNALRDSLESRNSSAAVEWEEAVQVGTDILSALPKDHPDRAQALQSLAYLLGKVPRQSGPPSIGEDPSIKYCEEALHISTAPPLWRIKAGMLLFNLYKKAG